MLKAQLDKNQNNLRMVYFDKFLALPYPYKPAGLEAKGLLMQHQEILRNLVLAREDMDVLYETGGGGSQELIVERNLGRYVNILTAGFPFFAANVLSEQFRRELGLGMRKFIEEPWYQKNFNNETLAIEELLRAIGAHRRTDQPMYLEAPNEWLDAGKTWVGRVHPRHWMIVTLHHFGAFAINLNNGRSFYCPAPRYSDIESTVGAGDVFRGAFCYGLLKAATEHRQDNDRAHDFLQYCTQFAVRMATERCRRFKMEDVLLYLRKLSQDEDQLNS